MEDTKPVKHAGGRPTKLTDQVQENLITAILGGSYLETAVAFVGIHKDTFYDWLRRADAERTRVNGGENGRKVRQKEKPYVEFSDAVLHALAQAEVSMVAKITVAGNEDWRALFALLERRYPGRWGRRDALEVTGPNKGPVEVEVRTVADVVKRAHEAHMARISKVERVAGEMLALEEGVTDDE